MPETDDINIPKLIGSYAIIKKLGSGGLGTVYLARHVKDSKLVALKVLHKKLQKQKKFLGLFHREIIINSGIKSPQIVSYIDAQFEPPLLYIVTQYIDGYNGRELKKKVKRLPPLVALAITFEVCFGLDHLHLNDIIHSDLSLANTMIDHLGRVYILDFGLSVQNHLDSYANYTFGTPGYYSPEHISMTNVVPQSDIFCVGLNLYEMITGQKAVVASKDVKEVGKAMKNIDYGIEFATDAKLNRKIRDILQAFLAFDAKNRYRSTEQALADLADILNRFQIFYPRYAVQQFLNDNGLSKYPLLANPQNIFKGA